MENLYPWYQVAWDLSIDDGMDPDTHSGFKNQIAEEISRDIQTGQIKCWNANGDPLRGGVPFEKLRICVPHLTTKEANEWLGRNGYLVRWTPSIDQKIPTTHTQSLSTATLANPEKLLIVFGRWGLKKTWFRELSSHKWLKNARRQEGQSHRGPNREPLFCPYAVMNGLLYEIRKPTMSENKGWDLLELNFKSAYDIYAGNDPRELTGD